MSAVANAYTRLVLCRRLVDRACRQRPQAANLEQLLDEEEQAFAEYEHEKALERQTHSAALACC